VIGRVRPSVSTLSLNQLTFDLYLCTCVGHGLSSLGIESQGHESRSLLEVELGSASMVARSI